MAIAIQPDIPKAVMEVLYPNEGIPQASELKTPSVKKRNMKGQ